MRSRIEASRRLSDGVSSDMPPSLAMEPPPSTPSALWTERPCVALSLTGATYTKGTGRASGRTSAGVSISVEALASVGGSRVTCTTLSVSPDMAHGDVTHLRSEGEQTCTEMASHSPKRTRTPGPRCSPCTHTSVPPLHGPRRGHTSMTAGGCAGDGEFALSDAERSGSSVLSSEADEDAQSSSMDNTQPEPPPRWCRCNDASSSGAMVEPPLRAFLFEEEPPIGTASCGGGGAPFDGFERLLYSRRKAFSPSDSVWYEFRSVTAVGWRTAHSTCLVVRCTSANVSP
mmetsp:Transcript_32975/g.86639  ORF Transcript_32975/g.86639 Transcript_32975/m.86639 type:complete len:287 (-) Transcript_32975:939-1799(-)